MKENFMSNEAHEKVWDSQCFKCSHNLGKSCSVYGDKPKKYVMASIGKTCPRRRVK